MEQKVLFLFIILVLFLVAFLAQKLIYATNIWLKFFEQDHLLNIIILMCTHLQTKTNAAQNLIGDFFSNFDCQKTFP